MIPQLTHQEALSPVVRSFVDALTQSDFTGDSDANYGGRLIASTDNSIYQVTPQAVLFPRSQRDVQTILTLANRPDFSSLTFTARGGGTGTNRQSLTEGIIVDLSRHMNKILEVDYDQGWARIEPGVVLDQLNAHLKAKRVFFAPDLAPSNRATIGGMVSTDASGKGSRIYGKTSNHILALDLVLSDGSTWHSVPLDPKDLQDVKSGGERIHQIHRELDDIVTTNQELVAQRFPNITRFLTGYNLAHAYDRDGNFNLNAIISGAEGTASINLIEFTGNDVAEVEAKAKDLCAKLDAVMGQSHEVAGYQLAETDADIAALWELRAKGVGLLGNAEGKRRPIPFVEDTVVPPEHLAAYIKEFRQVLDDHGLEYGMFGHVDVGCLHVRPALDLKDEDDEKLIRIITDHVKNLVLKYGGVVWGERGKGLRGEYMPEFFGPELYRELRRIKQLFDPANKLNPGKLVTPIDHPAQVKKLDEVPLRGHRDRQISEAVREDFDVAIHCNGNGACFNFDLDDVMCPSYKFTRDRIHSPKGRAGMMREWLRQLSRTRYELDADDPTLGHFSRPDSAEDDFSLEVYDAIDGCLSCKACTSMCPIKVDIPDLKAKFLNRFYTRYQRPLKDKLIAFGERTHHQFLSVPFVYNLGVKLPFYDQLMKDWVGLVDTPQLSSPNYKSLLAKAGIPVLTQVDAAELRGQALSNAVFILPDAITSFYEAEMFVDCVVFFKKIGLDPIVAPFFENGKGQHVKGFLPAFVQTASQTAAQLKALAAFGRPIIGIDPAITLTYREEYQTHLDRQEVDVVLAQEWLAAELSHLATPHLEPIDVALLGHCGEKTSIQASGRQWQAVFKAFGLDLDIVKVGCCGMAGAFGHEAIHYEESKGIYEQSWKPKLQAVGNGQQFVATGASCRSQVQRFEGVDILHPLQFLSRLMR